MSLHDGKKKMSRFFHSLHYTYGHLFGQRLSIANILLHHQTALAHYHLPPHQQDSCRVQLPSQWGERISEEACSFIFVTDVTQALVGPSFIISRLCHSPMIQYVVI